MKKLHSLSYLMLALAIFQLFGCSDRPGQSNENPAKEDLDKQVHVSTEKFKNRPIHKKLTASIIDSTTDSDLLQTVFDYLSAIRTDDYQKEYETVMNWNKSQQAIYLIWILETEVNNGGYNQFYYNTDRRFYKHLPDALRLVGANMFSDLTQRANSAFEKENKEITKHQDGTIEGFSKSYKDNVLNNFDTEFYELYKRENLYQLQINFIRNHKSDFIEQDQ